MTSEQMGDTPFLDLKEATIDSVKTDKTTKKQGVTIGGDLLITLRITRPPQSSTKYRPFMELVAASTSLEQESVSVRVTPQDEQQLMMFDGYSIVERLAREFKENMPEGVSFNFNSEDAMVQVNQAADELPDTPYE